MSGTSGKALAGRAAEAEPAHGLPCPRGVFGAPEARAWVVLGGINTKRSPAPGAAWSFA
jgi:hypothetical protein